ncbi:helix-turn-helix domain-containing protein [Trueperella pyogenes]
MVNSVAEWTAKAVKDAAAEAGRSLKSVSDETGIPYATLFRKTKGKTEFQFSELFKIAEALGISPATFTPPVFRISVSQEVA